MKSRRQREDAQAPEPAPRPVAAAEAELSGATELDLDELSKAGADAPADRAEADAAARAEAFLSEAGGAGAATARGVLIKTVKNDFWPQFLGALDRGDRSPCSPPPARAPIAPFSVCRGAGAFLNIPITFFVERARS